MDSLRFEVVLVGFNESERSVFTVASLHGVHKAVAMATSAHIARPKHHRIYKVEVREIAGTSPSTTDLVDRMEW